MLLLLGGCGNDQGRAGYVPPGSVGDPRGVDYCSTPKQGCECATEGRAVACGSTAEQFDDYVTCAQGQRTCAGGRWGACITDRIVQKPLPVAADAAKALRGSSLSALGPAGACPVGFDVCDPDCQQLIDSAGGFDAGSKFTNTTELKPVKSPPANCGSLAITPSAAVATVTQISPIVAPTITLSAVLTPPCAAAPFTTTWTIDRFDIGSITGTNSSNGVFTVANPVVGTVTVTAYAVGLSATTTIQVKVNALQSAGVAPNNATTAARITEFGLATSAAQTVTWLYPYTATYFPLGLPAPVVQYRASMGTGGAVKVSLRYPSGTSLAASTFNYSIIATESNVVSQTAGIAVNTAKPQVVIPQVAWQAFEQTARGNNADLIIQRLRSDGTTLETESPRQIYLVNGQLKGTVYYNSYSSQLNLLNTGAVLKIAPGATAPTLAVQPSGKCTVCHSVNLAGTRLISGGGSGGVTFNKSRRYDITTAGPAPTVLNTYDASAGDTENVQGDRFNFGGPWTDGSLYMTHGGNASTMGSPAPYGDKNFRAPPDFSRLYNVNVASAVPPALLSVTGWTNVSAVTPKFSPDGTKLAFGFWGGNAVTLAQSPTGSISADTTGKSLVVVDFKCSTPTCTGSSTGWNVSNARNLTPGVSHKVGWPAFTPNGDAVLYQRQIRSSRAYTTWSPSDLNTAMGALGEIWMSPVPANKNTASVPTQLRALNGLNPSPATTSYLPDATGTPNYHTTNGAFTINQADSCSTSADAAVTGVNDYQLNYLPAMAPTTAGGYNWVVFTSRRMYGNIADNDPWDAEPGPNGCGTGNPCTCSSGVPPTKKLWVAAINTNFTGGTDPSHPAFYLPGQELEAGNSDGFWVNSACVAAGAACSTNDDCCGGTGPTPTTRCDAATDRCQTITSCTPLAGACTTTAQCCTGLLCAGTGRCANPEFFTTATYQREYVAVCPAGTQVAWRLFEWQSTIPTGTSIDIKVQTKRLAGDTYLPAAALSVGSITTTTAAGVWAHGTTTANQVLEAAGLRSLDRLLVSLVFRPNVSGDLAPSLSNWRQNYDCVDSQ